MLHVTGGCLWGCCTAALLTGGPLPAAHLRQHVQSECSKVAFSAVFAHKTSYLITVCCLLCKVSAVCLRCVVYDVDLLGLRLSL